MTQTPPLNNTKEPIEIRGENRVFIVGKTRSGKSFCARYNLKLAVASGWRVVIVDPKKDWMREIKEDGTRVMHPYGELSKKFRGSVDAPILVNHFDPTIRVSIICPPMWNEEIDKMFRDILAYGNTIIYIDEITQLVSGAFAPKTLIIVYTQGGANGVGIWAGVQRPLGVPEHMKSQAEVWIIFRVIKYEDRMAIADYIPNSEQYLEEALPKRWFIFYVDTMDEPVLFPPLEVKEVKAYGERSKQVG